ncbi:PQ loop repeat-domain-containing protein [Polychytrium aggregatum]|uniref:PQ loop repeat-domain-containing protein n=1 Tax=Polychytrium aggregatum TaxID=110093 RepID=UPI0022FE09C3|nr:PQ loop repeat-domain-containing protein [Polychytrium aggregatum]KAI9202709.1 PQ loop repeat-domain-containing protein [Polychytrium aggregatum]
MVELSDFLGVFSILCWVVVIAPQVVVNYRRKSGEGVSEILLFMWLLADLFSLVGSVLNNLFYTVILLAIYHLVTDSILTFQLFFYRYRNRRLNPAQNGLAASDLEKSKPDTSSSALVDHEVEGSEEHSDPKTSDSDLVEEPRAASGMPTRMLVWTGLLALNFAMHSYSAQSSLSASSGFSGRVFAVDADTSASSVSGPTWQSIVADVTGYISAALYLLSRVPQIVKNYRNKSCQGLSILMFVFSVLGNGTYGASIICYSTESSYLIKNAPWILGAIATLLLDFVIFAQFYIYRASPSA